MLFDTDRNFKVVLSLKLRTSKLTCQIEFISLDLPYCIISMAIEISAIVSQLSKNFWLYRHPFFNGSAKVRAYGLSPKFFPKYFRSFWRDSQIVLRKTTPVLTGGAKIRGSDFFTKFIAAFSSHLLHRDTHTL